jgi:hypothetical protein
MLAVRDTVQNLISLLGSAIDPNTGANFRRDCGVDLREWRRQGGVAKKVIEFWPNKMATGFKVNVASLKSNKSSSGRAQVLKEWFEEQFEELDLLSTFREAEIQCQVDRAAPMVIITDGAEKLSQPPRRFNKVAALMTQDPQFFEPLVPGGLYNAMYAINHKMVYAYSNLVAGAFSPGDASSLIDAARVLPLQGSKLLPSEKDWNIYDKWWGRPLISAAVVDAALKLDMAIAAASILVQQKNTTVIGISGLFDKITMAADGHDNAIADVVALLKTWEAGRNLLNVNIIDKDEQTADYLDRNIAGVADLIQKLKENFLMQCPGIPETELFGQVSHGGLSRSTDDRQSINDAASELYKQRWLPQIKKLVNLMLLGKNCPVQGYNPSLVSVARVPSYAPSEMDQAKLRAITAATDEKLIKAAVITPEEARQRETGAGYQLSLNLEKTQAPAPIEKPKKPRN